MEDKEYINRLKRELELKKASKLNDPLEGYGPGDLRHLELFHPQGKELIEESKIIQKMKQLHEEEVKRDAESVFNIEAETRYKELRNPKTVFAQRVEAVMKRDGINKLAASKIVEIEYGRGE